MKLIKHASPMWVAQISGEPTHVLDAVGALGPESFWSLTRTLDELSLVSGLQSHPSFAKIDGPWVLFQVEGILDFGLTGILNSLTKPMADAGISIFAISTYNTDYILVKSDVAAMAEQVWVNSGFPVILL